LRWGALRGVRKEMKMRKSLNAILISVFCALFLPLGALADVDLAIDDVEVEYESESTLMAIVDVIFKNLDEEDTLETDITVFMDGDSARSEPLVIEPDTTFPCDIQNYPDCDDFCESVWHDDAPIYGNCSAAMIAPEVYACVCEYYITVVIGGIPYSDEVEVTVVVDYLDTIVEWDETNNEETVPVPPTPALPMSWSLIRAYYR
jgi:hypothetical protein